MTYLYPIARHMWARPIPVLPTCDWLFGMYMTHLYPIARHMWARPIPVLPAVPSTTVPPGDSWPGKIRLTTEIVYFSPFYVLPPYDYILYFKDFSFFLLCSRRSFNMTQILLSGPKTATLTKFMNKQLFKI